MSFHSGHNELRARQNILQDIHQQKQQLLQQVRDTGGAQADKGHTSRLHSRLREDIAPIGRRSALDYATSHSLGYFISQDSQCGNLILPVIPRIEK